jgi:hypothetical protein
MERILVGRRDQQLHEHPHSGWSLGDSAGGDVLTAVLMTTPPTTTQFLVTMTFANTNVHLVGADGARRVNWIAVGNLA